MNYLKATSRTQIYNPEMLKSEIYTTGEQGTQNRLLSLLSWEINFINKKVEIIPGEKTIIVYIGENLRRELVANEIVFNPAKNVEILAKMYHFIEFHFFDFTEFSNVIINEANVINYNRMIEESDFDYFIDKNVYLISNYTSFELREEPILDYGYYLLKNNLSDTKENRNIFEKYKLEEKASFFNLKESLNVSDIMHNKLFIEKINPRCAMVKFRPNHLNNLVEEIQYYSGILLMPIFSEKSMECRLIIEDYSRFVAWNFEKLILGLNSWNTRDKKFLALNPFEGTTKPLGKGLGNQMEICILFHILKEYFMCMDVSVKESDVINFYEGLLL